MWWQKFGFSSSPYFSDELNVSKESLDLFVGRENESRKLIIDFSEKMGGTILVGGISGSGKTSFLNVNQYAIATRDESISSFGFTVPNALPCLNKVQLTNGETFPSIATKILSSMVHSVEHCCKEQEIDFPKQLEPIRLYLTKYITQAKSAGIGGSFAGFGVNVSGSKNASFHEASEPVLLNMMDTVAEVAVSILKTDGISIAINNLEILREEYLNDSLNYMRDALFTKKGIWWFLLGPSNIHNHVSFALPRLAGIVTGSGIIIEPLSDDEILKVLEIRSSHLSIGNDASPMPIPDDVILLLYGASNGDMRFTFHVANEIVRRVLYDFPSAEIDLTLALEILAGIVRDYFKQLMAGADTKDKDLINKIIKSDDNEYSAEQFSAYGYDSSEEFQTILESLVENRLLWKDRSFGERSMFTPRGYLELGKRVNLGEYML